MNKLALSILFTLLLFSCQNKDKSEETIVNRIEFVSGLKSLINDSIWNGVSDFKYSLPLIYYTESNCYVTNPTEKITKYFPLELIHSAGTIKIYKTKLIDSSGFHMETSIDFSSDSNYYNYQSPVMNCSSFEITNRTISEINSVELWSTMVMHEYFHGFQFKHPAYLNHTRSLIAHFSQDSLKQFYSTYAWFKESVDKENEFLLKAITTVDSIETIHLIDSFLIQRTQRRNNVINELKIDISNIESIYETMEGSARYTEYSLYQLYSKNAIHENLLAADSSFQHYEYFKNFNLANEQWLYLTAKTSYYYATGFNLLRLFDKLDLEYKTRLFVEDTLTVEEVLIEYQVINRKYLRTETGVNGK